MGTSHCGTLPLKPLGMGACQLGSAAFSISAKVSCPGSSQFFNEIFRNRR
jgi:hypothetical protein